MKNEKKLLSLVLVVVMVAVMFTGCGKKPTSGETTKRDDRLAIEAYEFNAENWYDESDELFDKTLGEYYQKYEAALASENLAERYALQAIAEAKLLGTAVMIPTTAGGGNYAIGRVAPKTASTTLWGSDQFRYHNYVVATEFITSDIRDQIKLKWAELKGTGTFEGWVRAFLTENGYQLKDTFNMGYSSDPLTWDPLITYRTSDTNAIINTYDGLMEYDMENELKPALATEYTVSDDGLVYTFHIREGVYWVDSQGRQITNLTADDFVAGLQHLMDARCGLEGLVADSGAKILNAQAYINGEINDITQVGVKALDPYTLEYTLSEPVPFFTTMLSGNIFAPLCRAYYTAQGGKFGIEYDAGDPNYKYGSDPDHIAYCGPYLVTNATKNNTIVFQANPMYWNKDNITIQTITWLYNEQTDKLKAYNDAKAGTVDNALLNTNSLEACKKDGLFDKYVFVSDTNASSNMAFLNINRKAFCNFNNASVGVSTKTMYDVSRCDLAMKNVHFRRAVAAAFDRSAYNAQIVGEELKDSNLRNSYVPGNYVTLPEEVTVSINGTDTTFAAGTNYGEIVQAQLDADGIPFKAWDPEANLGLGSGDGYDGWYNPDYAKSELEIAVKELAEQGVNINGEDPIILELPYPSDTEIYANHANAFKQSVEAVLGGSVLIKLVDTVDVDGWLNAGFYPEYGYQINADLTDISGWSPDYGDPQTYLTTITPAPGGMAKSCGMY